MANKCLCCSLYDKNNGHDGVLANTDKQQQACSVYVGRSSFCLSLYIVFVFVEVYTFSKLYGYTIKN